MIALLARCNNLPTHGALSVALPSSLALLNRKNLSVFVTL